MSLFDDSTDAPDAIQALAASMGGGTPPAQISNLPQAPTAPASNVAPDPSTPGPGDNGGGPSLLHRLYDALGGIPGKIGDAITPATGMAANLSPSEVAAARRQALVQGSLKMLQSTNGQNGGPAPGVFQALGNAGEAAQTGFQGNVQQQLQSRVYALQQHARENIAQKYPPVAGETPEQEAQRLDNMASEYTNVGLIPEAEAAGKQAAAIHQRIGYGQMSRYQLMPDGSVFDRITGQREAGNGTGTADPAVLAARKAATDAAAAKTQAAASRAATTDDRAAVTAFNTQTADVRKHAVALQSARMTLQNLQSSDPQVRMAAIKQVPGMQASLEAVVPSLRQGLVHYYSQIDPSIPGKIMAALSTGTVAQLPPDQVQALGKLVLATGQQAKANYTRQYQEALKHNPHAAFQSPDALYGPDSAWGITTSPAVTTGAPGATGAVQSPAASTSGNPLARYVR